MNDDAEWWIAAVGGRSQGAGNHANDRMTMRSSNALYSAETGVP
jgi:hypothetical protein